MLLKPLKGVVERQYSDGGQREPAHTALVSMSWISAKPSKEWEVGEGLGATRRKGHPELEQLPGAVGWPSS
jgi:hypothetical protein